LSRLTLQRWGGLLQRVACALDVGRGFLAADERGNDAGKILGLEENAAFDRVTGIAVTRHPRVCAAKVLLFCK